MTNFVLLEAYLNNFFKKNGLMIAWINISFQLLAGKLE